MVDLFVQDRDFAYELAGRLGLNEPDRTDDSETGIEQYCFYGLDEMRLVKILAEYRERHEFEVRDENGGFIEVNRIRKSRLESASEN